MSNHTVGPWKATRSDKSNGADVYWITANIVPHNGERDICEIHGGSKTSEANARLIAAAPDLLEALREATLALDGLAKGEGVFKPIEQTIVLAQAAIAKAEAAE